MALTDPGLFESIIPMKTIKQLLKEGYIVIDQFGNTYQGEGIQPQSKAKAIKWYYPDEEKETQDKQEQKKKKR